MFDAELALFTTFALMQSDDISTNGPDVVKLKRICFTPEGEY